MNIAFLCGGEGSRLRPFTYAVPKPMLPIGSKPILEINITRAKEQGFKRVFLLVNYKAEILQSYFGDGSTMDVDIQYVFENEKRGTAGPLLPLKEVIDDPFLVMNADILTKLSLVDLLNFHKSKNAELTVALKHFQISIPYGIITTDEESGINEIKEKPQFNFLINSGIYAVSPEVLSLIPDNGLYQMTQFIVDAKKSGKHVMGYKFEDPWKDIGRMNDYLQIAKGDNDNDGPSWLKDLF
ncbi:MAG: sugar phosphate nucleotidyltransferase [Candidatus Thorarchaeota archaeon]